jgi:signal peptidase I
VSDAGYNINGAFYPRSPNSLSTYMLRPALKQTFEEILQKLDIPLRDQDDDPGGVTLRLTSFEEYRIREELSPSMNRQFIREEAGNYRLIVPRKDEVYRLSETFLIASREAIRMETGDRAEFRSRKLFLDGKETDRFRFGQDYYWVLSDNINEGVDSRHLGFIPAGHIIGNAWFCWYSKDRQRMFRTID